VTLGLYCTLLTFHDLYALDYKKTEQIKYEGMKNNIIAFFSIVSKETNTKILTARFTSTLDPCVVSQSNERISAPLFGRRRSPGGQSNVYESHNPVSSRSASHYGGTTQSQYGGSNQVNSSNF
jgi:hypothetical protein